VSFEKNFCSSPWIHTRINNQGDFEYCRWMSRSENSHAVQNIRQVDTVTWFQKSMAPVRKILLDGGSPSGCQPCCDMEKHGKISGRQKQLLKTGVVLQDFTKTMLSSPWVNAWHQSHINDGVTATSVQDWQIDLGNFCNSACVFCGPENSSRLAAEFKKIGLISELPKKTWCDDPAMLEKFLQGLRSSPAIKYLHFIGGETLITPAFKEILLALISSGLNVTTTIGFTTNLTVMDKNIVDLLQKFHAVHLGVSIECLDRVNDYVRYGSQISQALDLMQQWLALAKLQNWLVQIRTTPTVLTVSRLADVYEYAWRNHVIVESCNFLHNPACMKPSVLPAPLRQQARDSLISWIASKSHTVLDDQIVNIRNQNFLHQQLIQDAQSYVQYLDQEPDASHLLPDLVSYLKRMDENRGNYVLDYLPEYEELFRSAGY
jgi:sulfatase maturation enzyme AslB (radical SAM superfamily)